MPFEDSLERGRQAREQCDFITAEQALRVAFEEAKGFDEERFKGKLL